MYRVFSCLASEHDYWFVGLAGAVCIAAALTSFRSYAIARASRDLSQLGWIVLAGVCAGTGIWATHFVAMLAYKGGFPVAFWPQATLASLLVSISLATAGFGVAVSGHRGAAGAGGAIIGAGAGLMHYVGMAALIVPGTVTWDTPLVAASWALAIVFAWAATMAFDRLSGAAALAAAAGFLTLGICGLHFTSMGALTIVPGPATPVVSSGLDQSLVAAAVAGVTLIVLMAVLAAAVIQRANQRHEVALREQNARFDVALSNMPVGLSMFDAEHRLIVCNRIYRELYDLPHELTQPGTPFAEIMRYYVVKETGGDLESLEDMHDWLAQYIAKVGQGKQFTDAHRLHDGRTVLVTIGPMANGGWVDVQEDITERRQNEARIEYLARHDHLTGLANRVLLRECLGEALKHRAERGDVALHCLDLDRFKEINDTLGHPAGDAILKLVTERIRGCVRDNDTIARLGGDEFVVLQVAKDPVQVAPPLASRLIEAISEPYEVGGHEVHVGASVGIAVSPIDSTDPDTLLKHADMALYRAKSEGRGRWSLFEQEMNTRQHARFLLARDLRSALANGELEIHYQPILNLSSGEVSCCEALIRWRHPERGLVSPAEFVPVAEETGLIVPISEWVLRQACAEAARWPERVRVAVNISPFYWKSRALSQMVFSAVAASRIAPSRLELEITESALLNTNEATRALLNQLHNVGVRIAMDDFGTGYSSLSYLRNLPFQKIKIDRCFVKDLSDSGKNAIAIIRAISALGRALDLTVTAEGVETQEQLEAIRAEGCTEMQGYLFSPPLPAAELSKYFRRRGDKTATASAKARVQRKPLRRASAARPRRRGGAP